MQNSFSRRLRRLGLDDRGVAVIEMALILPLLLMLAFGMIEIGYYLFKMEVVARSVSTTARTIQDTPTDPSLQTLANNSASPLVVYGSGGNYICAKSYATLAAANGSCASGTWNVSTPAGVTAGNPYYVAIRAVAVYSPLTPVASFISGFTLGNIVQTVVVKVGGNASVGTFKTSTYLTAVVSGSNSYTCPQGRVTHCSQILNNGKVSCYTAISGAACVTVCGPATSYGGTQWSFQTICGWVQ